MESKEDIFSLKKPPPRPQHNSALKSPTPGHQFLLRPKIAEHNPLKDLEYNRLKIPKHDPLKIQRQPRPLRRHQRPQRKSYHQKGKRQLSYRK